MATHKLKVWSEYMDDLINGNKSFEVRFNDRNFHVGDVLILEEFDKEKEQYLSRSHKVKVTYLLDNKVFDAIKKNCILFRDC